MKVRAVSNISGPMGNKVVGDEFSVTAAEGKDLIDRGLVESAGDAGEPRSDADADTPAKTKAKA